MSEQRLGHNQWTRFWEKGLITTFSGMFENNYDGELKAFWEEALSSLPTGANIIDLGTGNGALAILASEIGEDQGVQVTGVDFADIDPSGKVLTVLPDSVANRINFRSRTSMEATGLDDETFDAAISQFGFEYADPEKTVAELSRILKANAKIIVMMHREESILHRQALDAINQINICERSQLHYFASELLKRIDDLGPDADPAKKDDKAEQLRFKLNEVTGKLHDMIDMRYESSQIEFYIKNTVAVFHPNVKHLTFPQKLGMLAHIADETRDYRERMGDLCSAIKTEEAIAELGNLVTAQGFTVEQSTPFELDGQVFCHAFVASR